MTSLRSHAVLLAGALLAFAPALLFAQPDAAGCQDHPLVTRMQNMRITTCKTVDFDKVAFKTGKATQETVEGRRFEARYQITTGQQAPARLAIIRNHQDAIKAIGGTVKYEDDRYTILNVAKGGKDVWVQVDTAWGGGYMLVIVERQAMVQEVVASAALFASGLKATGHVEVPGIFFDTGKAALKPESAAAVGEIAALLKADPAMKVYIVGHTDSVASLESNLKLSQARAEAVAQALIAEHGIAATRLSARGVGPLAPVASNDSEDGRAKNRRVELVKQ